MQKFILARRFFGMEEQSSSSSPNSIIYISSTSDEEQSDSWDSDWSTDTEDMIRKVKREVAPCPMLIGGRVMTTGSMEEKMTAGPSTTKTNVAVTPTLDHKYFDEKLCYAPSRET